MTRITLLVLITTLVAAPIASAEMAQALSEGISADDRAAHPEYPLKLVFFIKGGAYLANVKVQVHNQKGEMVYDGTSQGPWLFLDLMPGEYIVTAIRDNGDKQGAKFTLTKGAPQKQLALMFPD